MARERARPGGAARLGGTRHVLAAALAFLVIGFAVYGPALEGPPFSDDAHYLVTNPYVRDLTWDRFLDLFDPRGDAVARTENFAPVHLLIHAGAWSVFGENLVGHHALNVVLHAGVALLLGLLLRRSGVPDLLALAGAAFFLVHPANVEAVAWMSQAKTVAALGLAMGALLAFERLPLLATVLFALGLLTKPPAAVALPVAALFLWARSGRVRRDEAAGPPRAWLWLGVWTALFALFAAAEMAAFREANAAMGPAQAGLVLRVRTAFALWMRYVAMAGTSYGLAAFHEPPPVTSWLDPWWLGGLGAAGAIGWRAARALRARSEEAAWWLWGAISFLPVSQVFPFPFPLADRYLYAILPGLLGGCLLAGMGAWRARPAASRPLVRRAAVLVTVAALAGFGIRAHGRALLWGSPPLLLADSARRYPDGMVAQLQEARRAMERFDHASALDALSRAERRGFDRFDQLLSDPAFAPLQGEPRFQEILAAMGERWIRRLGAVSNPKQSQLITLALAHELRGETERARELLEEAARRGGPMSEEINRQLELYRRRHPGEAPAAPGLP